MYPKLELNTREVEASEKLSTGFLGYVEHIADQDKMLLRRSLIDQYMTSDDVDERAKGRKMRDNLARSLGLDF